MQLGNANISGGMKPVPQPASTPLRHRTSTDAAPRRSPAPRRSTPSPSVRKRAASAQARPAAPAEPRRASPQAVASAARQYTGAFSGALNNLSEQEQRVADVASRRRADAERYTAFVMGQQGTVAAAAASADQQALANIQSVQGATQSNMMAIQGGMQSQRAAQGLDGSVPYQQLAGVVDDQNRTQMLLGAAGTKQAVLGNANRGRAQFLQAAALANMNAHQRAISGEEFEQQSAIGREKTGVLTMKTQENLASRRAAAAAQADIESAQIGAESDAADRASRESIAGAGLASRESIAAANRENSALQGRANRRARLKAARAKGSKGGGVSAAETRQRGDSAASLIDEAAQATARARDLARAKPSIGADGRPIEGEKRPGKTVAQTRARLYEDYPGISAVAVEAAIDAVFPQSAARRRRTRAQFKKELTRRKRGR